MSKSIVGIWKISDLDTALPSSDPGSGQPWLRDDNTIGVGANTQAIDLKNTYTSSTNQEFGRLRWSGNVFELGTGKGSAGGSARGLTLGAYADESASITPWLSFATTGEATYTGSANLLLGTGGAKVYTFNSSTASTPAANGTSIALWSSVTSQTGTNYNVSIEGDNATQISGERRVFKIGVDFTPTSGTGRFYGIHLPFTINQTGGASGITRGIYVQPALTSAADWRSIETSNNSGYAFYAAGTAPSYFGGNIELGHATDTTIARVREGVASIEGKIVDRQGKSISIPDPTNAEDISLFRCNEGWTITKMVAVLVGSATPSVTWTIRKGSDRSATGTEVVTGGTTTTSTTTGSVVTSFNSGTFATDDFVWLETSNKSGTVDELHVTIFMEPT